MLLLLVGVADVPLALVGVSPTSAPATGGTLVTLTGSSFRPGVLRLNYSASERGPDLIFSSETVLLFVTGAHPAGVFDLTVWDALDPGRSPAQLSGAFTLTASGDGASRLRRGCVGGGRLRCGGLRRRGAAYVAV